MLVSPRIRRQAETLFPFLERLEPAVRSQFLHSAMPADIPRGQMVCHEGGRCRHLALMLSGSARVYKLGENGRDITLYRVRPGQSCILTASCILSGRAFPAFAECEETAAAVLLKEATVRDWIARSQVFRDYVFGLLAQRLGSLINVVEEVAFQRLDQRLGAYLLDRRRAPAGRIDTTHQEIASDLGSSREVISRLLKDFENGGCIHTGRGFVEIRDATALRQRCGLRDLLAVHEGDGI